MKRILAMIVALILLVACGTESEAKQTVEDYLEAVKLGSDFDQMEASEGFIDVFNYEYLQTLEEEKIKDTETYDYETWKEFSQENFDSFIDYKDFQKELNSDHEVITDNNDVLELWDKESYYEVYTLLYNVEIANEAGEKLYKKAEITVEEGMYWNGDDVQEGWVITDVYLR